MKNKLSTKKIIFLIIFAAALVVGVPFIINESYKTGKDYLTLWGAADVLSYYGMILAAAGTGLGVFFSIKYSQKQYQEDKRQRILPFFSINRLGQKKVDPFLKGLYEMANLPEDNGEEAIDGIQYHEYAINKAFFFIEPNGITYSQDIDDEHREKAETLSESVLSDEHDTICKPDVSYIPFELKNVGNGCAINMQISISGGEEFGAYTPPISVSCGEKFYLSLYVEKSKLLVGQYTVNVEYQDIFGNLYEQCSILKIDKFNKEIMVTFEIETNQPQRLVWRSKANADA